MCIRDRSGAFQPFEETPTEVGKRLRRSGQKQRTAWVVDEYQLVARRSEMVLDIAQEERRQITRVIATERFAQQGCRLGNDLELHLFRRYLLSLIHISEPTRLLSI